MKSRLLRQRFIVCFLATNYFILPMAALAVVEAAPADLSISPEPSATADKKKAITLTAKWSLPFQGQLNSAPNSIKEVSSTNLVNSKNLADPKSRSSNDLSLFAQKKYQVLTLAPPETLSGVVIADEANSQTEAGSKKIGKLISGGVSVWDGPFDVDRIINHLLEIHFSDSPEGKKLDQQVKRQSGIGHKALAVTKDGLYEGLAYQGIEPSMRAGKLILDSPDIKIRNKAWADYARQRYIDKIHAQVVTSLMQISEGIGSNESEHGKQAIASGKKELSALVGEEEAERAVKGLTAWLNNANIPYSAFAQTPWNTIEHAKVQDEVLKLAIDHDPVIAAVTKRLKKYAYPSQLNVRSSQIIQTTLNGITIFAPGVFISPAAATMEVTYKLATGGSEENKLERELLFDKRIQSRLKVLTQESSMALDNYRYALVTKNPPLLAFSQEVLENLTDTPTPSVLLSAQDYNTASAFVPEIKESGKNKDPIADSTVNSLVRSVRQLTICPGHGTKQIY